MVFPLQPAAGTLGRDQGEQVALPQCVLEVKAGKKRERKDGSKPTWRKQSPHIREDFSQKHSGLYTSSTEQEGDNISPPIASRPARSQAKHGKQQPCMQQHAHRNVLLHWARGLPAACKHPQ